MNNVEFPTWVEMGEHDNCICPRQCFDEALMILQVNLYDGNTFWHILVLRRLFAADEGYVVFLECSDALEDSTAESGSLLKSTC